MIRIKSITLTCSVCGFSSIDPELFLSDENPTTCNECIRKELQMPEVEPSQCKICGKTITNYGDFCEICQCGMNNARAMIHMHEWKLTRRQRNRYKIFLSNLMVAKYQSVETGNIDILQKRLRSINGAFKSVFTTNARKKLTEDYQKFICKIAVIDKLIEKDRKKLIDDHNRSLINKAIADSLVDYTPGEHTEQESILI